MDENNSYPSPKRAWLTVSILLVAYVLSFVDRQILNLLVGPIRQDLQISDTEMSLLMGLSFAVFYTVAGIPLGRIADSKSRRGLIAAGVAVWSLMTAFCGLAQQYWHFIVGRIGVGAVFRRWLHTAATEGLDLRTPTPVLVRSQSTAEGWDHRQTVVAS